MEYRELEDGGSSSLSHLAVEDRAFAETSRRGGSRGGRRGRGRGGGGGGGGQPREVQVSKALSKLLRHQAGNAGIKLDEEGYAPLDQVLAWGPIKSLQVSLAEVKAAVANSDKQRFALKCGPGAAEGEASDYMIRANQGHSIKLESAAHLEALSPEAGNIPPRVVHGTYFAFWPAIVAAGGLRTMGRNHVHFATGTGEEVGEEEEVGGANSSNKVISGMRRDAELLVEVDVARSIAEVGLTWWRSDNGVVLCEGDQTGLISSRFFRRVTGRRMDVGVLWEEGEWVTNLPKGIKAVVPPGKTPRGERGGRGRGQGRGG